ncbi:MAG: hypothetical protein LBT96_03195 [Campylobacteraceae bacterium]|jgi:hypothetical protein|nr:hypothetical protein [Campylobacteraceae bacterium]
MRKILLILFSMPYLLFSQSIYPLPFTFDDSGFYVEDIVFKNIKDFNTYELGIFLTNADDDVITLGKHTFLSVCQNIKTLEELYNYKNIYKDEFSSKCYYMADKFTDNSIETVIYGSIIMLIDKNYINNEYYHNTQYSVLIFENKNYLGKIGLTVHTKDKLYKILRSIKPNKNIKNIDEYIQDAKDSITNNYLLNMAFKNIVSAMLLDANRKDVKVLLQKIYDEKSLSFTKNSIKELETLEGNQF